MKSGIRFGFFLAIFLFLTPSVFGQVNFTSSNLPIVVINTNGQSIPDEPKITADMGIIFNGPGVRNNMTDPLNNYNGKIGIELRGSTSQALFPKKQYGIELRDATGKSIDASLLGLPKKDDWVLFAPYDDKSLMRDVLAYKLGRDLGRYASRFRYCEMVLNGEYMGVFVLFEKIKRDKNRVNIDKLDPTEITGDNLTGGYIIKIDKTAGGGGEGWTSPNMPPNRSSNQTIYFQYEYPKPEDIVTQQKEYIRDYVSRFENSLLADNFKDPAEGYANYADVGSFIDYFIANELPKNPDAYRLSTFIHKKKDADGGKLSMGPIWDFNLGFGNVNYCTREFPEGFVIYFNTICPQDYWLIPFWWNRLFEDDGFKAQLAARWTSLRSGPYQTAKILGFIDSVSTVLNVESQQRNFQRWPVLGQYVWPNAYIGQTFQQEVDWLKDWTSRRLLWLDANIPGIVTSAERKKTGGFLIAAFPNPVEGQLFLDYEIDRPGIISVDIFDIAGRKIDMIEKRHDAAGKYQLAISQQHAMPGTYLVRARWEQEVKVFKIIKR